MANQCDELPMCEQHHEIGHDLERSSQSLSWCVQKVSGRSVNITWVTLPFICDTKEQWSKQRWIIHVSVYFCPMAAIRWDLIISGLFKPQLNDQRFVENVPTCVHRTHSSNMNAMDHTILNFKFNLYPIFIIIVFHVRVSSAPTSLICNFFHISSRKGLYNYSLHRILSALFIFNFALCSKRTKEFAYSPADMALQRRLFNFSIQFPCFPPMQNLCTEQK